MKNIFLYMLSITFILTSCTKDFDDINVNPTTKETVPTSSLFAGAMQDLISMNSSLGYNKTLEFYSQQWSQRETTVRSRYGDAENGWGFYSSGLPELYNIIELNTGENAADFVAYGSNNNQIACAKIMRAWAFMNITDAYGNVPYSEAFNPDISKPKYDSQESIYTDLVAELTEAVSMMDGGIGMQGDLMYGGDMNKWAKFANSLRARLGMRISERDPALAQTIVNNAMSAGVFTSNDDNAEVPFQSEASTANPLYAEFLVQSWTYVSKTLIDEMTMNNTITDPRVPKYAAPNQNGLYVGLPYGLTDVQSTDIAQDSCSHPSLNVRSAEFPSILMTYSEVKFIEAEMAARGWSTNDATTLYNDAITSSMEYWGVDAADITSYLGQAAVVYDAANWRTQLGTQKWISLFTQGAQAWASYRRLDYPDLQVPDGMLENGATAVPRRYFYNSEEAILNGANLADAISAMGGDDFSVHVWWDN